MSSRSGFYMRAVVAAGAVTVLLALQAADAGAGSVEQPVEAQMEIVTQASGTTCHASVFAVVTDAADAVEYRVTYTRAGRDYAFTFNRHERGNLRYSKVPTWSPGPGKVAGLLTWAGKANSTGDNCAAVRAYLQEQGVAIKDARVVRYTPDRPRAGAAAVEMTSVALPPANDGTTGRDYCEVLIFLTVPRVKGAVSYRVRLTDAISGATRTKEYLIDPAKAIGKGPAGTTAKPYRSTTRVGHYLSTKRKGGGWGCRHLEWQISQAVKSVKLTVRKS